MTKLTANYAATLEGVFASVPKVDFPSVSPPELERFADTQKAVAETLARVLAPIPKVDFPTVSLGRLEGLVEFQEVMDAHQRRWQSLARQIVPPVRPRPDLSAVAASVPLPRPVATRDEVAALEQRVIAGEQRNRALEHEIVTLKQQVVALEMRRVFPDDPDFPH